MTTYTALATSLGVIRPSETAAMSSTGRAPAPHFDSILRAAPAYDDDDDGDNDDNDNGNPNTDDDDQTDQDAMVSYGPSMTVAEAIDPNLDNHASLHAYLDANATLPETIRRTQERIHDEAGRLTSRKSQLAMLEKQLALAQEGKGKGAMLWTPKKKRTYKDRVEKATIERDAAHHEAIDLECGIEKEKRHLAMLCRELTEYRRVEARLDALDNQVFGGPTRQHPDEDTLEQTYHIVLHVARRLQAVVQQEKRALQPLNRAHILCQAMIKELLKALNVGIEIGVASNVKHKNSLFAGTSSTCSSRASRGMMLRAKTLCGDIHTHYISARAIQRRIAVLPKLEVLELTRMPDQRGKNVVNEVGLHRAVESSYAQCKAVKAHVEREQHKCKSRQRLLREHIAALDADARMVWCELRAVRRSIIEEIRRERLPLSDEEVSGASAEALTPQAAFRPSTQPSPVPHASNPFQSPSTIASPRHSTSAALPPPYRRELASQDSLGIQFPPLTSTTSGTLADFAASNDWQAREQHRLLTLPHAFRRYIDRESIARSRAIIVRIAIEVGGVTDDDDLNAVGEIDTPAEEDIPGFHLAFAR